MDSELSAEFEQWMANNMIPDYPTCRESFLAGADVGAKRERERIVGSRDVIRDGINGFKSNKRIGDY